MIINNVTYKIRLQTLNKKYLNSLLDKFVTTKQQQEILKAYNEDQDEREENIYVLNYLLCGLQLNYFNGHMFEYARET